MRRRSLFTLTALLAFTACTADEGCVDRIGSRCVSDDECNDGDACVEIPARGFFCVPPDNTGIRIANAQLSVVQRAEGRTRANVVVRGARITPMKPSLGETAAGITLIDGDFR